MAKNDFKAFATGKNANVMSQEEWEALPALLSGFTAGKASSAQVNKVIRQASFIAAALAQFVSDKTQRDVLDNGDLPGFVELLGSGFAAEYLSRKNPFGDIKLDGTVKTALENLGLRETGSSGEKIPLLSTENTWSGKQIFSAGAAGELDGNAATATKLKTPVRIDGVEFDGSADISLHRDIIDYDALQHKIIHDIDYAGIFDGADNMSQGFCICDTP
ncbi:hypothetical protein MLW14_017865, partial [Escherichia coli]|nr:hypothetical protein [Escherichia coli]